VRAAFSVTVAVRMGVRVRIIGAAVRMRRDSVRNEVKKRIAQKSAGGKRQ